MLVIYWPQKIDVTISRWPQLSQTLASCSCWFCRWSP